MTEGNLLELLRRNSSLKSLYGMDEGILSAVKAEQSVISDLLNTVFFVICRHLFLYLSIAMTLSLL